MDKSDWEAKERARAARQQGAAASTPGAERWTDEGLDFHRSTASNHSRGTTTSRPGARAMTQEETQRLDERIAAKQERGSLQAAAAAASSAHNNSNNTLNSSESTSSKKKKKKSKSSHRRSSDASNGAGGSVSTAARTQLNQLEADVASKSRASRSSTSGGAAPGAVAMYGTATNTATARTQLNQLEADVAAKSRASSSTAAVAGLNNSNHHSARAELNRLEADVEAKSRASGPRSAAAVAPGAVATSSASGGGAYASARAQLNQLEADVQTKSRSSYGEASAAAIAPGAVATAPPTNLASSSTSGRTKLNQLEADVAAKRRIGSAGVVVPPAAAASLNELEADVASKNRARPMRAAAVAQQPGAHSEIQPVDRATSGKSRGGAVPPVEREAEIDRLDQRIDAKFRGEANAPVQHHRNQERQGGYVQVQQAPQEQAPPQRRNEPSPEQSGNYHPYDPYLDEMKKLEGSVDLGGSLSYVTVQQQQQMIDAAIKEASQTSLLADLDKRRDGEGVDEMETTTNVAARGMLNQPDVEYGTTSPGAQADGMNAMGGNDGGLAVAVAITAEEEDAFIPAAIQYDPESKPPLYRNRRFRLWICVAIVLLAIVVGGTVLGVTQTRAPAGPTAPPTTIREGLYDWQGLLAAVVGDSVFEDPDSPHSIALDWLVNQDQYQVTPDDANFVQRFILAVFYISTSLSQPWASCNPPEPGMSAECNFKKYTEFFPEEKIVFLPWMRWMSEVHECGWAGTFCDEFNQTRAIELVGQELRGELPKDLVHLPYLQSITLVWNELYGTLPSELATMKHLLNIELHFNFFSGQIPHEWYSASALQRLNLGGNRLTGTIPTEIGRLSTMKGFFFMENDIHGTIPTEIGDMKFLAFTRFYMNELTGTLPTEVGRLAKLREIWYFRTVMSGTIPTEIMNMRDMTDFRAFNLNITGSLPVELFLMPQLERFDAHDTLLTGSIPTEIGLSSKLVTFRVRNSLLTGTIPTEMGLLSKLREVWLHKTLFDTGATIPDELCDLRGEKVGLVDLTADCKPELPGQDPVVLDPRECATACCERIERTCNSPAYIN